MIRVHVICEGHTEEMFVKELLTTHMMSKGIHLIPAKIGRPGHKGGNVKYPRLLSDIKQRLLSDAQCFCTTLLDFYGLPTDFPGKANTSQSKTSQDKFQIVTDALSIQIEKDLGEPARRFVPYIQMHEFEGILFSAPKLFAESINQPALVEEFIKIRQRFAAPEEINDSPQTAPSKRVEKLFNGYDKPLHPLLAARKIGLETIRQECALFDDWVKRLELLKDH